MSLSDLYKLAFRGMKGRHPKFQMHYKNVFLAPAESSLSTANIVNNSIVHINVPDEPSATNASASGTDTFEELCLIKVFYQTDKVLFSYVCKFPAAIFFILRLEHSLDASETKILMLHMVEQR